MLVTLIADASFCPDTGAAGYGYWVVCARGRRIGSGAMKSIVANNNSAEMMAIANGLYQSYTHGLVLPGDHVLVQTDCQAAILGFEGRRKNITAEEVGVAVYLTNLKSAIGITLGFRHVKGHTSGKTRRTWVNNNCDALAGKAMAQARKVILTARSSDSNDASTLPCLPDIALTT